MQILQLFIADVLFDDINNQILKKTKDENDIIASSFKLVITEEEDNRNTEFGLYSKSRTDSLSVPFHQAVCILLKEAQESGFLVKLRFDLFAVEQRGGGTSSHPLGSALVVWSNLDPNLSKRVQLFDHRGGSQGHLRITVAYLPAPPSSSSSSLNQNASLPIPPTDQGKEYAFLLHRKLRRPEDDLVTYDKKVNKAIKKDTEGYAKAKVEKKRPQSAPRPNKSPARIVPPKRAESPKLRKTCMSVGYVNNAWPEPEDYLTEKQLFKLKLATEKKMQLLKDIDRHLKGAKKPVNERSRSRSLSGAVEQKKIASALQAREEEVRHLRAQLSNLKLQQTFAHSPTSHASPPSRSPSKPVSSGSAAASMERTETYRGMAERLLNNYHAEALRKSQRSVETGKQQSKVKESRSDSHKNGTRSRSTSRGRQQLSSSQSHVPGFFKISLDKKPVNKAKESGQKKQKNKTTVIPRREEKPAVAKKKVVEVSIPSAIPSASYRRSIALENQALLARSEHAPFLNGHATTRLSNQTDLRRPTKNTFSSYTEESDGEDLEAQLRLTRYLRHGHMPENQTVRHGDIDVMSGESSESDHLLQHGAHSPAYHEQIPSKSTASDNKEFSNSVSMSSSSSSSLSHSARAVEQSEIPPPPKIGSSAVDISPRNLRNNLFPDQLLSRTMKYKYAIQAKEDKPRIELIPSSEKIQKQFAKNRLYHSTSLTEQHSEDMKEGVEETKEIKRVSSQGSSEDIASDADTVERHLPLPSQPIVSSRSTAPSLSGVYNHREAQKKRNANDRVREQFEKNRRFKEANGDNAKRPVEAKTSSKSSSQEYLGVDPPSSTLLASKSSSIDIPPVENGLKEEGQSQVRVNGQEDNDMLWSPINVSKKYTSIDRVASLQQNDESQQEEDHSYSSEEDRRAFRKFMTDDDSLLSSKEFHLS
eukprot:gene8295-9145_t